MSANPLSNGLRAATEKDRSPDFIEARDRLVGTVNAWLAGMAGKRDAHEPLADGGFIADKPRVTRTMLGRTAVGFNAMVEETTPGVSLDGDGSMKPYILQAVRQNAAEHKRDIIEVTGSDPMARQFADGGYSTANTELVMGFSMTGVQADNSQKYFGYEVRGDGSMYRKFVSEQGVHTVQALHTAEEVSLAQQAFQTVQAEI